MTPSLARRSRMRQAVAVTAVASTLGLLLAACGGGSQTATDSSTVTIMAPYFNADPPSADGQIAKKLNELTGKTVKITWAPNAQYEDKTNITLASSDVPQVMVVQGKSPGFVKNAQAGAFWDLTDKLKNYPNLATNMPDIQKNASVNGKVYGVFRARQAMRTSVIIRKDWLDKLHLAMPKTVDDLYTIAKAFTQDDPDGDGKADTTGIEIPKWPGGPCTNSPYDVIETWFGAGNCWTQQNGKLVPSFETPQFLQADAFIKKMVSEKLINADFATFDSTKWNEPFLTGKAGIIIDVDSRVSQLITLYKQQHPNDYQNFVTFTGNLTGPDGQLHALPTAGYAGFLAIPKASVKTDADLDKVLTFLNKLNSADLENLLNNGIQDVNYTVTDGKAAPVTPATDASKAVTNEVQSGYGQLGTNVIGNQFYPAKQATPYEQSVYDQRMALTTADLKSAVFNPAAPFVSPTYVSKGAQLDNIIADARIKYFAGQIDEQGLKDAIARWESSGGSQVKDEINKLYSGGGQ
ncbi:extracellular solute-binding protein [Sinomonas sp. G460-2]|uniref:extracellular solute-binding protein n=1 Tax=Sinomonas sp. G460-2 TaxID=3393464 RepID=UPI0039F07BAA